MGVGGATWETAGTLTLGSGNTFDIADVTEVGTVRPYNHAWWVYTPSADVTLTLDTNGSTASNPAAADTLIQIWQGVTVIDDDDDGGTGLLSLLSTSLTGGVTYHILVGTYDEDGNTLTSYVLDASALVLPGRPPQPRIPGRPIFPAGDPTEETATEAVVYAVSTLAGPLADDTSRWWTFTAPEDGRLSFDTYLSTGLDGEPTGVILNFYLADPHTILANAFQQLIYTVRAGETYHIRAGTTDTSYLVLRISDYAPSTEWLDSDDVQIITGRTTDGLTIPPDPVATIADDEEYIQPLGTAYGFEGAAAITHYPQFEGDPGYGLHPWLFTSNWEAIWSRATQGKWTTASDWGPSAGVSNPFGFDSGGYWDNNRVYADWPVGYFAESSAIDGTPPDGHQEIAYTVWAFHWHIKVSRFLYDYPGGDSVIVPWVIPDEPDDRPEGGETWDLLWDAELGDPPTLKTIEVGSNPAATGATFAAGDPLDGFFWDVRGKTLSWEGDPDFQNGHWYQDSDPDVPAPGDGHDIYRGLDIVDGAPDTGTFARHGYYGPGPIPTQGDSLASWQADNGDWHVVLDGEETIAEYLAYEAPGLADEGHSARTDVGSLILSAIPAVLITAGIPDRGFLADARSHASFNVFASLRGTYARPRHRWIGAPVIPDVVSISVTPPRRIFQRSDGATHGARRVGAGNTRQSGSRTLGAIL